MRPGARWIMERAGGQRLSHWPDGCCSFQTMSFWTTGIHPGQAQKKPAGNQRAENLWRRGGDSNSRYLSGIHDFQSCSFGHLGHLSVCSDVSSLNGDGWQVFFCVLGGFLSGCMKNVWNACAEHVFSGPFLGHACVRRTSFLPVFLERGGMPAGLGLSAGFGREIFGKATPSCVEDGRQGQGSCGRASLSGANPWSESLMPVSKKRGRRQAAAFPALRRNA